MKVSTMDLDHIVSRKFTLTLLKNNIININIILTQYLTYLSKRSLYDWYRP